MNLNYLAVFHAVAQTGNMTLGAERLDIGQSAVSKQVQELAAPSASTCSTASAAGATRSVTGGAARTRRPVS
jgi:hypothetical protein